MADGVDRRCAVLAAPFHLFGRKGELVAVLEHAAGLAVRCGERHRERRVHRRDGGLRVPGVREVDDARLGDRSKQGLRAWIVRQGGRCPAGKDQYDDDFQKRFEHKLLLGGKSCSRRAKQVKGSLSGQYRFRRSNTIDLPSTARQNPRDGGGHMRFLKFLSGAFTLALAFSVGIARAEPVKIRVAWVTPVANRASILFERPDLARHMGKSYTFEAVRFQGAPPMITAMANGELEIADLAFSSFALAVQSSGMNDLRVIA